ncbi:MAG: nuclear transport factor 2 family protein [Verrucomicrobia bacterium]|nr:nuclear transport factor 2 family protein [Verrucomicrobiota bacterium]
MSTALDVVRQGYAAFGRHDIPTLLKLVADEVDWQEICPGSLPYSGQRRNPAEVGEFFAAINQAEEITVFEPREFIEAGENVTVLGYLEGTARDTEQRFQTEWVHVFTVQNSKITRWRGFTNTAARYGY